jgi:hypothetical protein
VLLKANGISSLFFLLFALFLISTRPSVAAKLPEIRKAADQGNVAAQFNLGLMYNQGQGITRDYAEAVRWYRKADLITTLYRKFKHPFSSRHCQISVLLLHSQMCFPDKLLAGLGNLSPHAPGLRFEEKRTVVPVPQQALPHARLELTAAFVSKRHDVRTPWAGSL